MTGRTVVRREYLFDLRFALLLMLAFHGVSLWFGELRGDDFIFLREGRLPLAATILQTWGGHMFPLWRIESAFVSRVWGANPVPLRFWLFAQVALLAFLHARVLAAWGLSRSARFIALVVFCGWTQWAQITMGYWTLSITVKVWIATSAAMLAVIGTARPGAARNSFLTIAAIAAILEDSTGAIVVPAIVLAALASGVRDGLRGRELIRRVEWPVAIAFICAVVFLLGQWVVHLEAAPLLGAIGGGSFVAEALYLLGVGTIGMLAAPILLPQLPHRAVNALTVVLAIGVIVALWRTWRRASRDERAPLAVSVALFVFGLVMIVGARPYANYYFMVGWTHYMAFLYIPAAAAIAVAWDQARRIHMWAPRRETRFGVLVCAGFIGAQTIAFELDARMRIQAGERWEVRDAGYRHDMVAVLHDSLFAPLAAIVPPGGRMPQMLSTSLDLRFPKTQPALPVSFYDERAGFARGRFRWAAAAYANGETSDASDAATVTHMKGVVDPAFQAALHRPSWWRDTYFASTPLEPTPTPAFACDALRRGASPMNGDADRRHWLLLDAAAGGFDESTDVVDIEIQSGFRERAVYQVAIPPDLTGCMRVELLHLPEFALSDTIALIGVHSRSGRHVAMLGLFPPAKRATAKAGR